MFNEMLLLVRYFLKAGFGQSFHTSRIYTMEIVRPFKTYEYAIEAPLLIFKQAGTFLPAI
jgi:hypothetical protein